MRSASILRPRLVAGMLITWVGLLVAPSGAVEQAEEFLNGLRQRGMHDTAMVYLDQMRTSPLCPPEFKETLDYEAGVTLLAAARTVKAPAERQRRLDQAKDSFEKFLKEHPDHTLASGASIQLANVLVERGRSNAEEASGASVDPGQKAALLDQARERYTEAEKLLQAADGWLVVELKNLPQGPIEETQAAMNQRREQLRGDLVQTRLLLADVAYQTAITYNPTSDDGAKRMTQVAKQYSGLYEKYGSRLAGLVARMGEARCYRDLGDKERALVILDELLAQPDEPQAVRNLKDQALILYLETCMSPPASLEDYKRAATASDAWEKSARTRGPSGNDGLTIQYLRATAHLGLARTLKSGDPARERSLTAARKAFLLVARAAGEYAWEAQKQLRDPLLRSPDTGAKEPTNFSEATDRAKVELEKLVTAQSAQEIDRSEGNKEKLAQDAQQIADARAAASKYCHMALDMRIGQTPIDQVNMIRYYQSYLDWLGDDLYQAAVLGEFLAYRYPGSPAAGQGAKIAIASYAKLFNEAKAAEERQFAARRLFALADFVTQRWPASSEARDAWIILLRTAVANGELDKARGCLARLPAESPGRAEAELFLGRALWAAAVKADKGSEKQSSQAERDKMIEEARGLLQQGVGRIQKAAEQEGAVDATFLAGVLTLVQIDLRAGQPQEAIKRLEDPTFGPLALAEAGQPTASQPEYAMAAYKAALRAYVATGQLDKAEAAMNALEKLVAQNKNEDANKNLTLVYIGLGRELQDLLERLLKDRRLEEATEVAGGFKRFLTRIAQRKDGNTFQSLNWVAETFMGLGASMDPGGKTLPDEVRDYYEQAAATYREILARIQADPTFTPQPDASIGVKIRLAKCLRKLGNHKEAMTLLAEVLRDRNTMIDAQVQAAYTYQALGQENPDYYRLAVRGGQKVTQKSGSTTYLVWGWGKIARMVAPNDRYADIFHEARYNLALCRFRLALSQGGEEKAQTLKQAQTDIELVQRLYPKMGGDQWRAKYDTLLRQIQRARELAPTGLEERMQNAK